jgi:hypothetical protein
MSSGTRAAHGPELPKGQAARMNQPCCPSGTQQPSSEWHHFEPECATCWDEAVNPGRDTEWQVSPEGDTTLLGSACCAYPGIAS